MPNLKFVVLTDFSPLAKVALQYAAKMAAKMQADITILNTVRVDGVPKSNLRWKQIEKEILAAAEDEGKKLVDELSGKSGNAIYFKALRAHTVAEMVKKYTDKNKPDLVIMGSQGASQLKKARLGGTTVSVIDSVKAPVLAIPKFAEFKSFKHVVYATDLRNIAKELELLIPFLKGFGSHLHVVHVVTAIDKKVELLRTLAEEAIQQTNYPHIDFKLVIDDNVPDAIDKHIKHVNAELLTTFTHELNLYEKLFGLSVTRRLAYQGNIPLLAFKRKA
jgi:nucleotide-binding universal stress UspA family protein